MNIGESIRIIRKQVAPLLKQGELADKAGLSQSYMSNIERGVKTPSKDAIDAICAVLEIPPVVLYWYVTDESHLTDSVKDNLKIVKPFIDAGMKQLYDQHEDSNS